MKKNTAIVLLSVCLLGSLSFNFYQKHTIALLGKLPLIRGDTWMLNKVKTEYPINGLKEKDITAILELLKSIPDDEVFGTGILSIEALDDNRVIIDTGKIRGPAQGGGRCFGFIRTNNGWDFYNKDKARYWLL